MSTNLSQTEKPLQEPSEPEHLLFFNYHEIPLPTDNQLIVTHFPNHYNNDKKYRVVRIPRVFDKTYPKFSNVLPGLEEGAIVTANESIDTGNANNSQFEKKFKPIAQGFGNNSMSPLSDLIDEGQFKELIDEVNERLEKIYEFRWWNIFEIVFNTMTLNIYEINYSKKQLDELDDFILKKSEQYPFDIVSLKRSGYLSLDILVPFEN